MTKIKIFSNVFLMLFFIHQVEGQRFNFGLKGGLTFSQVNGDALTGYDKLGFEAGAKTNAYLSEKLDLSVELLYSQRGSSDEVTFGGSNATFSLTMNYIAIPVLLEFKDWEVQEQDGDFYRMHFAGGFAYGNLFSIDSNTGYGESFLTDDLSWLLGIDYYFNRHFSLSLRYTRSIIRLDEVVVNDVNQNVIPHHITLGTNYMFL